MKNTEQKPPSDFEVMADFNRLYSAYLEARKGKRWNTLSSVSKRTCWKI